VCAEDVNQGGPGKITSCKAQNVTSGGSDAAIGQDSATSGKDAGPTGKDSAAPGNDVQTDGGGAADLVRGQLAVRRRVRRRFLLDLRVGGRDVRQGLRASELLRQRQVRCGRDQRLVPEGLWHVQVR
jgi:hypothetical protein